MRKYHRWLSVLFGVFLLWISVTGVLSQIGALVNNGGFEDETEERGSMQAAVIGEAIAPAARAQEDPPVAAPVATSTAAAAGFVCPPDLVCRPKPQPRAWNIGLLHHLHSGEQFGPAGVVISILSGLALLFFSFSGLWMYIRMWSHRRTANHQPRWFWK